MTWDLSCPDWEDRLRTGRPLVPDLPLNQAEGDRAVAVLNKLRLADVPGIVIADGSTSDLKVTCDDSVLETQLSGWAAAAARGN